MVRFAVSVRSLIDLVTCIPMFVSAAPAVSSDGAAAGFAIVRVLRTIRILRVMRIARLGSRLGNEIQQRSFYLGFTIVCSVLCAAGIFHEVEGTYSVRRARARHSPRYPFPIICRRDLRPASAPGRPLLPSSEPLPHTPTPPPAVPQDINAGMDFHTSVYWATVTLATLGYGDFAPTLTLTRMLLIGLIVMLMTLLPYQTSKLVMAYNFASPYLRKKCASRRRCCCRCCCRAARMVPGGRSAAGGGGPLWIAARGLGGKGAAPHPSRYLSRPSPSQTLVKPP